MGKRLMKIAVRNKNNEPIDLWRSIIRIIILYLPVLFNGWAIPFFQIPLVSWLASIIVFGFSGALLYTMIFNKKTRLFKKKRVFVSWFIFPSSTVFGIEHSTASYFQGTLITIHA